MSKAPAVEVRPLRYRDLNACVRLERALFAGDGPWSYPAFAAELDSGAFYLGAYREAGGLGPGEQLIGYGGIAIVGRPGEYETSLHTIGVAASAQGQGIGTALLRRLLARADELAAPMFLEVRTDNDRAIALYERHGFQRVGVRRGYYQPSGADAYTMSRPAADTAGDTP